MISPYPLSTALFGGAVPAAGGGGGLFGAAPAAGAAGAPAASGLFGAPASTPAGNFFPFGRDICLGIISSFVRLEMLCSRDMAHCFT